MTTKVTYTGMTAEQQECVREALDKIKFKVEFGIDAEDEESAKKKLEEKIYAKLQSGKPLSPKEMQYLRRYNPALYMQAVRVEQKRKSLENQLENADSKEEVQDICNSAMASVREEDPAKQYVVAAIQETVKEFKKSDQYKKLPETRKQAEEKENRGTGCGARRELDQNHAGSIRYEVGENSYQMAYAAEDNIEVSFHAVS